MGYRFENLNIWIEARAFLKEIYKITSNFPSNERYILGDQIKRAALSIVLNIAEGSDKNSDRDFTRYLRISLGSVNEVVTCLFIALDFKYIKDEQFKKLYDDSHKISAMINSLIRKLNEKK